MVQGLRLRAPNAGGLVSIPDLGTRFHTLQLKKIPMPQRRSKTPWAATKTQRSQRNEQKNEYIALRAHCEDTVSMNNFQSQHYKLSVISCLLRFSLAIASWQDSLNSATEQKVPFLELQKKKSKNGNKAKLFQGPGPNSSARGKASSRQPWGWSAKTLLPKWAVFSCATSKVCLTLNDSTNSQSGLSSEPVRWPSNDAGVT